MSEEEEYGDEEEETEVLSPELQAKVDGAAFIIQKFSEIMTEFRQVGTGKTNESLKHIAPLEKNLAELKKIAATIKADNFEATNPQVEAFENTNKKRTEVMAKLSIQEQEDKIKKYALLIPKLKKIYIVLMGVIEVFDLADNQKARILTEVYNLKVMAERKVDEARQNLRIFKRALEDIQTEPTPEKLAQDIIDQRLDALLAAVNVSFPWQCPVINNDS